MAYVDGFIVPVPKKNIEAYRKLSRKAGKIWKEYGAIDYWECVADDVKPGKTTSFPQSVKLKAGETVIFSDNEDNGNGDKLVKYIKAHELGEVTSLSTVNPNTRNKITTYLWVYNGNPLKADARIRNTKATEE